MGDGQKYHVYKEVPISKPIVYSEPWFGKRNQYNLAAQSHTASNFKYFQTQRVDKTKVLISLPYLWISKRLTVPDDYFVLSQSLSYQYYDLNNYNTGYLFGNGSRNLAYTVGLSRSNKGVNPIFPTYGSDLVFQLNLHLHTLY
jgi:outer membrane protein insertion porin family